MPKGIGLAGGYAAGGVGDALVDLLARKFAETELRRQHDRQDRLDADQREERAFNRARLTQQDERQVKFDERTDRIDAEAREDKDTKRAIEMATLFPGKVVSGETMRRVPKHLQELIAKPKDAQLASRSVGGVAVAGDPNAGDIDIEAHEAVAPGSFELQMPVSERMRLAAERAAGAETKRTADERFRQEKLDRDTQHRERMAEIAAQRANQAGSGAGPTKIVQGRNEQGQAVSYLVDREGNILKSFDRAVSSADARAAAETEVSAQAVQGIRDRFKPTYVGPLQGRILRTKNATGVKLTPEEAAFAAAVAHMKNEIIRDITGAAVGVQEEGRIMGEIPDLEDPAETFLAKLAQTEKNRQFLRDRAAHRAGTTTTPKAGPDAKDPLGIR